MLVRSPGYGWLVGARSDPFSLGIVQRMRCRLNMATEDSDYHRDPLGRGTS